MKKVLSVLVAVLLVVVACVPAFAATTGSIDLGVSATEAKVGDTVTVQYYVGAGVAGIKAILEYNTTYFELVSATDNGLFGLSEMNTATAGKVVDACADTNAKDSGVVFTATFKVLKTGGTFTAKAEQVVDADDASIVIPNATVTIKAPSTTTTAAPATTAAAGATTTKAATTKASSVSIPKTGGSVSVVACGASVLALAAAVAFTMKKKNED